MVAWPAAWRLTCMPEVKFVPVRVMTLPFWHAVLGAVAVTVGVWHVAVVDEFPEQPSRTTRVPVNATPITDAFIRRGSSRGLPTVNTRTQSVVSDRARRSGRYRP